jgi:hypothetical protein
VKHHLTSLWIVSLLEKNFTKLAGELKTRVPDTFQLGAISWYCAFSAGREINNLRVFNTREYSDSPRLQDFN